MMASAHELKVSRYCIGGLFRPGPDFLQVTDKAGNVLLDVRMGPDGPLHPKTSAEAKPWFFTGSPFGREILELARERGVIE